MRFVNTVFRFLISGQAIVNPYFLCTHTHKHFFFLSFSFHLTFVVLYYCWYIALSLQHHHQYKNHQCIIFIARFSFSLTITHHCKPKQKKKPPFRKIYTVWWQYTMYIIGHATVCCLLYCIFLSADWMLNSMIAIECVCMVSLNEWMRIATTDSNARTQ